MKNSIILSRKVLPETVAFLTKIMIALSSNGGDYFFKMPTTVTINNATVKTMLSISKSLISLTSLLPRNRRLEGNRLFTRATPRLLFYHKTEHLCVFCSINFNQNTSYRKGNIAPVP